MSKFISLFSLILIFSGGCTSEFEGIGNNDQLFMKFFGGAGEDFGNAVLAVDGGFAILGSTRSYGNGDSDLFIVITDENGNALFNKSIGGPGNQYGSDVIQIDNSLLAVGHTEDSIGNSDIWVLEMSMKGDSLKSWTFGENNIDEVGIGIQATSNGNLIITSTRFSSATNPDTYMMRLDDQMQLIWENKDALNDLSDHFGKNIIEGHNNEVIYCSTSKRSSGGKTDMRLTAINSIGEVAWNVYFGENNTTEEANAVITHQGSLYLTGSSSESTASDSDILLIKTNRAGTSSRILSIGEPGISESGQQLVSLSDGNLLLVGERKISSTEFSDIFIIKIDNEGNYLWDTPYILSGSLDDFAADALEMPNGDLVICGTVSYSGNPMMLLLKMNKDGKLIR